MSKLSVSEQAGRLGGGGVGGCGRTARTNSEVCYVQTLHVSHIRRQERKHSYTLENKCPAVADPAVVLGVATPFH